ncbi:FAD-dependent oxidoreductase [Mycobacterium tuberculosis]|uniref:FAD-dependent oxidoreductase n=1 Tax=Mycobacterium tuberculosis TaxID=1773 RepID=UPI00207BDF1D|nr:FAD-dependent oxidoreductase [Mycobacterium tuberculosis]
MRGGGHSYIGASSANGAMVLDLLGLPGGVHFDSATRNVRCRPRPISMRSIKRWPGA